MLCHRRAEQAEGRRGAPATGRRMQGQAPRASRSTRRPARTRAAAPPAPSPARGTGPAWARTEARSPSALNLAVRCCREQQTVYMAWRVWRSRRRRGRAVAHHSALGAEQGRPYQAAVKARSRQARVASWRALPRLAAPATPMQAGMRCAPMGPHLAHLEREGGQQLRAQLGRLRLARGSRQRPRGMRRRRAALARDEQEEQDLGARGFGLEPCPGAPGSCAGLPREREQQRSRGEQHGARDGREPSRAVPAAAAQLRPPTRGPAAPQQADTEHLGQETGAPCPRPAPPRRPPRRAAAAAPRPAHRAARAAMAGSAGRTRPPPRRPGAPPPSPSGGPARLLRPGEQASQRQDPHHTRQAGQGAGKSQVR